MAPKTRPQADWDEAQLERLSQADVLKFVRLRAISHNKA